MTGNASHNAKEMKPFIILDFDGVLNCRGFKHEAVKQLNRLTDLTDADIVISSSWRKHHNPLELRTLMRGIGVHANVVGVTPLFQTDLNSWQTRVLEIETYLASLGPINVPFVILDDQRFHPDMFDGAHVATNYDECLTAQDVDIALDKLRKLAYSPYVQVVTDWSRDAWDI